MLTVWIVLMLIFLHSLDDEQQRTEVFAARKTRSCKRGLKPAPIRCSNLPCSSRSVARWGPCDVSPWPTLFPTQPAILALSSNRFIRQHDTSLRHFQPQVQTAALRQTSPISVHELRLYMIENARLLYLLCRSSISVIIRRMISVLHCSSPVKNWLHLY